MPDGIQPVGAMVQPPSLQNSLGTLSSLYGVKQAQQNLQTGQYTQQSAQATASQDQQKNAELQKAQQVAVQGAQSGAYDDGNGGIDRQKMANDILKVAPVYGQPQVASLLSQANEITTNKKAVQALTVDRKNEMGNAIGALAADPNVDNSKVIDTIEKLRLAHPNDPEYSRLLTSQMMHLPNSGDPKVLQDYLGRWSAGMTGTPQVAPTTVDTGPAIQGVTQNKFTGAITPGGPPVNKGLTPTQQPGYIRSIAAAGAEGGQGASNDEKLYNDIVQSGTKATQIKSLSQDVQGLANEVQTGQYSKAFADKWSALAQTFGLPQGATDSATKRQLLSKTAARLKMLSEAGASTDAERQGIEAAMPDPEHMDPKAVQESARYVGAQADTNAARMDFANKHRQINGGASTGLRSADSQFMQSADPKVFEYQSIAPGKARQDYLKQHFTNADDLKAFLSKQETLKTYGAVK